MTGGAGSVVSPKPFSPAASGWVNRFSEDSKVPVAAGGFGGFDELFSEVVPPRRPETPGPSPVRPQTVPTPRGRKSSEAMAIDRIFQNFCISSPPPSGGVSPVPAETAAADPEEAFSADLANVLVWFEKDLTQAQRMTATFTLLSHLTAWQLRFVLGLLSKPSEAVADAALASAPPGFQEPVGEAAGEHHPEAWHGDHRIPTPLNSRAESQYLSSADLSQAADLTLEQCNPELFQRDVSSWLKSLRLHKYDGCLGRLRPDYLLGLVRGGDEAAADVALERLGVGALGARRKFIRVLVTIQQSLA